MTSNTFTVATELDINPNRRSNWSHDSLRKALQAVFIERVPPKEAAVSFSIPQSTLYRYLLRFKK